MAYKWQIEVVKTEVPDPAAVLLPLFGGVSCSATLDALAVLDFFALQLLNRFHIEVLVF